MYINFTNFLHDILHYWHVIYGPKGSNALFVLFIVIAWIKFEMAIVRVDSICLFICNRKTCLCI